MTQPTASLLHGLNQEQQQAVLTISGPILVVAGLVEGFVSPTATAPAAKFTIAAALFVLFTLYLARAGRTAPTAQDAR